MNVIDIIVYSLLAFAIYNGWKRGVTLQVCSLAGLLIGIYLALAYRDVVSGYLNLTGDSAPVIGFIVVLLATMVVVTMVGYAIRRLFHLVGFGVLDIILGIVVSIVKYALLLSILFSTFDRINTTFKMVDQSVLNDSKLYRPIIKISDFAIGLFEDLEKQIPKEYVAHE